MVKSAVVMRGWGEWKSVCETACQQSQPAQCIVGNQDGHLPWDCWGDWWTDRRTLHWSTVTYTHKVRSILRKRTTSWRKLKDKRTTCSYRNVFKLLSRRLSAEYGLPWKWPVNLQMFVKQLIFIFSLMACFMSALRKTWCISVSDMWRLKWLSSCFCSEPTINWPVIWYIIPDVSQKKSFLCFLPADVHHSRCFFSSKRFVSDT